MTPMANEDLHLAGSEQTGLSKSQGGAFPILSEAILNKYPKPNQCYQTLKRTTNDVRPLEEFALAQLLSELKMDT